MRKILMLTAALAVSAASQLLAAVECNCTYCQNQPNATCVIHTYFQTSCQSYTLNFCVDE